MPEAGLDQRDSDTGLRGDLASGNSERLFRTVVEAAPYAMILVDHRGDIAMVNAETERIFGYRRDELIGQKLEILLPEPLRHGHAALRAGFLRAPEGRAMGSGRDLFGRRKDGSQVPMEVGLNPVETDDGPAVLAAITDITLRKQSEAELRRLNAELAASNQLLLAANSEISERNAEIARKNEEVEAFVYIVSHDLRAPLVNLQGFSRELELNCAELEQEVDRAGLAAAQAAALRNIIRDDMAGTLRFIAASVGKFDRLINALLLLSRTGARQLRSEPVSVTAIVDTTRDAMHQICQRTGARIEITPLPDAVGDATAIGQVFGNLLENALKYAHPDRPPRIVVGGEITGNHAHYWVRDNGMGIPEQARPRLFQVFQRFHPNAAEGDGIGLAAVKRMVERQGGAVWVESEPGTGSTFHFTLPCHEKDC